MPYVMLLMDDVIVSCTVYKEGGTGRSNSLVWGRDTGCPWRYLFMWCSCKTNLLNYKICSPLHRFLPLSFLPPSFPPSLLPPSLPPSLPASLPPSLPPSLPSLPASFLPAPLPPSLPFSVYHSNPTAREGLWSPGQCPWEQNTSTVQKLLHQLQEETESTTLDSWVWTQTRKLIGWNQITWPSCSVLIG